MWNEPTPEQLAKIPKLYETEKLPLKDEPIYIHFFIGGCDWFISGYDGKDLFFGYAIIGNPIFAEWGYVSFGELKQIRIHKIASMTSSHVLTSNKKPRKLQ